jgi:hypothetical protein
VNAAHRLPGNHLLQAQRIKLQDRSLTHIDDAWPVAIQKDESVLGIRADNDHILARLYIAYLERACRIYLSAGMNGRFQDIDTTSALFFPWEKGCKVYIQHLTFPR